MIYTRAFFTAFFAVVVLTAFTQTSTENGLWEDDAIWDTSAPGTITDTLFTLPNTNPSVTISSDDTVSIGSFGDERSLEVLGANDSEDLTVAGVLVVYGSGHAQSGSSVYFANKSMNLVIPDGGTMIVFGDLLFENKITLSSGGTLVVTGSIIQEGGNEITSSGGGTIYAGGYDINGTITGNQDTTSVDSLRSNGLDDIADFIDGGGQWPLPVTLTEFNYSVESSAIKLSWVTMSETNFDYFELQRANSNGQFETLTFIEGHGESHERREYKWGDENPYTGVNYYRLVSHDFDGYKEIFKPIMVSFIPNGKFSFTPNPVRSGEELKITGTGGALMEVKIYNLNGQEELFTSTNKNIIRVSSEIPPGIYLIELSINGIVSRDRLIIK